MIQFYSDYFQGERNLEIMSKYVKNTLFIFWVALVFVFSFAGNGSAATLKDIPVTSATEINYLLDRAIVQGYPDGTFRPYQNLTRDEAAIMIGKALGLDGTKRKTVFPDVSPQSEA